MRLRQLGGAVSIKPYRGPPRTLGNAAAARVRLEEAATWRRIVWVSAPGDYATFNSNQTPDGTPSLVVIVLMVFVPLLRLKGRIAPRVNLR